MDHTNIVEDAHGIVESTVGHVKDAAEAAIDTAKDGATTFVTSAKERVNDTIEHSRQAVGQTLIDFAEAIRKAGDELAERDQSFAGRMLKQAADGLEGFSKTAASKRPDELLTAARDFGRSNPVAFITGSVLLGVAVGRFVKSSATHASSISTQPLTSKAPVQLASSPVFKADVPVTTVVWTGEADPVETGLLSTETTEERGFGLIGAGAGLGGTGI